MQAVWKLALAYVHPFHVFPCEADEAAGLPLAEGPLWPVASQIAWYGLSSIPSRFKPKLEICHKGSNLSALQTFLD